MRDLDHHSACIPKQHSTQQQQLVTRKHHPHKLKLLNKVVVAIDDLPSILVRPYFQYNLFKAPPPSLNLKQFNIGWDITATQQFL